MPLDFEGVTCAECNAELQDPMAICPRCGGWERLARFNPRSPSPLPSGKMGLFSWVTRDEGCCKTHGLQSFLINANGDAFCPMCACEVVEGKRHHLDKTKIGL